MMVIFGTLSGVYIIPTIYQDFLNLEHPAGSRGSSLGGDASVPQLGDTVDGFARNAISDIHHKAKELKNSSSVVSIFSRYCNLSVCLSVCLSVSPSVCLFVMLCIVAKRYILQQGSKQVNWKCRHETQFYNFQPPTLTCPHELPMPNFCHRKRTLGIVATVASFIMQFIVE